MAELVDVVAVQIKAPHARRVMERNLTPERAESYIKFAVYRRGVEYEFYTTQPASAPLAGKGREP